MGDVEVSVTPAPPVAVEVSEAGSPPVEVALSPPPEVVEVLVSGPPGPPGPPGTGGGGSDAYFVHSQDLPSSLWRVEHGLGKRPAVTVFDSAGTQVEGDVEHLDASTLTIEFAYPFGGAAYLN